MEPGAIMKLAGGRYGEPGVPLWMGQEGRPIRSQEVSSSSQIQQIGHLTDAPHGVPFIPS
jgi:hypothetical protein